MARLRRVITLGFILATASFVCAQTELPPPPRHASRGGTSTTPATQTPTPPARPGTTERHLPHRPIRPDSHRGTTPASMPGTEPAAAASQESEETQSPPPAAPDLALPATRPARDPQVVELQIASSEDEPWGRILIELYPERTPVTNRTFLQYVNNGYYDGTIFHRIIPGFVIQGGGYTSVTEKKTDGLSEPIRNECRRGTLKNARGMVAMARKQDPHSAVSQFFINLADNEQLDYPRAGAYGYCVFGKVVEGMDVVDRIAGVETKVSAAAQRRFDRYAQEGRPVEKAEQSEPLSPPVLKHARLLSPSEIPPSVLTGPTGRRKPQSEQQTDSQPTQEAEESQTEQPATEPAATEVEPTPEPAPALESSPAPDVESSPDSEEATSPRADSTVKPAQFKRDSKPKLKQ